MKAYFSPVPRFDRSDKPKNIIVSTTTVKKSIHNPIPKWSLEKIEEMDKDLTALLKENDYTKLTKYLMEHWPTFFSWPGIYKYRHMKLRDLNQVKSAENSSDSFFNFAFAMQAWLDGMKFSRRRNESFDRNLFINGIEAIASKLYASSRTFSEDDVMNFSRDIRGPWTDNILQLAKVNPREPKGIIYRTYILGAVHAAISNFKLLQEKNQEDIIVPPSLENTSLLLPLNGFVKPSILHKSAALSERILPPPQTIVQKKRMQMEIMRERQKATRKTFELHTTRLELTSEVLEGMEPLIPPVEPWWFDFRKFDKESKPLEQGPKIREGENIPNEEIEEVARIVLRNGYPSADADAPIKELEPYVQYEKVVRPTEPTITGPGTEGVVKSVREEPTDKRRFSDRFLDAFPGRISIITKFETLRKGYAQYQSDMETYMSMRHVKDSLYPYTEMLPLDRKKLKQVHASLVEWIIEQGKISPKNNEKKIMTLQEMFQLLNDMYQSVLREKPPKLNPIAKSILYHNA